MWEADKRERETQANKRPAEKEERICGVQVRYCSRDRDTLLINNSIRH